MTWASALTAGANKPDVGREDREAAAAATAIFDDDIFGSDGNRTLRMA